MRLSFLMLLSALASASAWAEEPAAAPPAAEPTTATAPASEPVAVTAVAPSEPAASTEYVQDTRGVALWLSYVVDTWGKAIPALIDFQWAGVRSYQARRLLFTFDAAGGFSTGYGGNSNPKFFLYGANLGGRGELGWRMAPERDTSFYLGGTAVLRGSAVGVTTASPSQYDQINSVDGIAGLNGVAALRVNPGVSLLHGSMSLLVTAFAEESLRDPGSSASGPLFTSFGARAQFDVVRSWTATLEGAWGTTFGRTDALGTTNSGSRFEVTASVRKILGPVWLALDGQIHGTSNSATTSAKTTYVTSTPTYASVGLTFGVSL
jgi:hypothetical protein